MREANRVLARLQELSDTFRTSTQAMNDGAQRQFHETDMIATATEEIDQSHAIAEVTGNLAVIRDISEQTSGQSAAAATDSGRLSAMAKDLRGLLKQFRVSG